MNVPKRSWTTCRINGLDSRSGRSAPADPFGVRDFRDSTYAPLRGNKPWTDRRGRGVLIVHMAQMMKVNAELHIGENFGSRLEHYAQIQVTFTAYFCTLSLHKHGEIEAQTMHVHSDLRSVHRTLPDPPIKIHQAMSKFQKHWICAWVHWGRIALLGTLA